MKGKFTWLALSGALGTSFAAGLCCLGPLLIVTLGLGGAWFGMVNIFAPLRPYLIGLVLIALGYAFFRLYISPPECGEGEGCILPSTLRLQRTLFWIIAIVSILLMTFPWYEEYLF